MDEAHASSKEWNSGDDQLRLRWMIYLVVLADAAESVRDAIGFEYYLASSSGWTKSPVLWVEIGGSILIGPELVQEMIDKVVLVRKSSKRREIVRRAMLILGKCLGNSNLHVPLHEIKIDKTLHFVEEPAKIMDHEIKSLKRSRIPLVKVRWNSKRGPETRFPKGEDNVTPDGFGNVWVIACYSNDLWEKEVRDHAIDTTRLFLFDQKGDTQEEDTNFKYFVSVNARSTIARKMGNGNECCERLAFYGMSSNLVRYFKYHLNEHSSTTSRNLSTWIGTCYLTPLTGAFVADTYLVQY
ncbi:putative reverse transcriptase domain-containing protein [Tanacetum coccineum]